MKTQIPLKKYFPVLLFIIAFSGFLSTQIIWDSFDLSAKQVQADKQKDSLYETQFQALKLTTTKSTTIELKNLKEPIVVLNFWASWCIPCLKEFPSLVKFQSKYGPQVKVIGINGDEENALMEIKKIEGKYQLNFETASDAESTISNKFLISSYPVSIVFHQGKVVYVSKKIHNFMDEGFLATIDDLINVN
jgi:thiol-disulfide isomerase/thioredoxin